jgi:hypothetical protein
MRIFDLTTWVPKTATSREHLTRYILAVKAAARNGKRLGPVEPATMCFAGSTNSIIRGKV